jgi:hypothetical protein
MRTIFVGFFAACLLGLIAGCHGSNRVEMPAHPVPPPKNPTFTSVSSPEGAAKGQPAGFQKPTQ